MILTEFVEVKIGGKNIKHYNRLGYNVKLYDIIIVPIEHLTKGSHYRVLLKCDYCYKEFTKIYKTLFRERNDSVIKKDCCQQCIGKKDKEVNMALYGVSSPMYRQIVKDTIKSTVFSRYGVEFISQNPDIAKKISNSQQSMSKEAKLAKKEKTKKTNRKKYGVDFAFQLDICRKNLFLTRTCESSQQKKVCEILIDKYGCKNVFANVPESKLLLDIVVIINDVKINVEYDSWYWHEEQRDRKRDEFLKTKGYKILRIKSGKNIPNPETLFLNLETLANNDLAYSYMILKDWNQEGYLKKGRS
jgi:hypothetical protein